MELNEAFDVVASNGDVLKSSPYEFTERGLMGKDGCLYLYTLKRLLTGEFTIQKHKWMPKDGEIFWFVTIDESGVCCTTFVALSPIDIGILAMGNCFQTEKAAEAWKAKILAKFEEIKKGVRKYWMQ